MGCWWAAISQTTSPPSAPMSWMRRSPRVAEQGSASRHGSDDSDTAHTPCAGGIGIMMRSRLCAGGDDPGWAATAMLAMGWLPPQSRWAAQPGASHRLLNRTAQSEERLRKHNFANLWRVKQQGLGACPGVRRRLQGAQQLQRLERVHDGAPLQDHDEPEAVATPSHSHVLM